MASLVALARCPPGLTQLQQKKWLKNWNRKQFSTQESDDGCTLHVRGVLAGKEATANVSKMFSKFGTVVQVSVRERTDPETGADTSWALVTMSSRKAAALVVQAGVTERLDPAREVTVAAFNNKQADASLGAMVQVRKEAAAKIIQSKWRQYQAWVATVMMALEQQMDDK